MRYALVTALGIALLAALGCAHSIRKQEDALEDSQRKYTELVRWGEIERASAYVDPEMSEAFIDAAAHFKDIRFTDFESGPLQFDEKSESATVSVVYHAYSTRTLVEKRFVEHQQWYRDADAENVWRVRPNLDSVAKNLNGARRR
ncbi:MAG: hypothetical protein JRE43_01485 [Deltaproteobacteria bacterium]|jgi:hypothetical protein|nr:hypothetical protein [Deltaproteobacteria bacterium]